MHREFGSLIGGLTVVSDVKEKIIHIVQNGHNEMEQDQIEKHSTAQSLILHFLPGVLVGCFYFLALKGTTKKNIYLGMIVHMLCNVVGFVTGIIYISNMM